MERSSGIILHPTSFFSSFASGDLGDSSKIIIDWLRDSGFKLLQILPLGPTGYGDSPYQSFSSFAGTPYIISFDYLVRDGFLKKEEITDYYYSSVKVDYGFLYQKTFKFLNIAFNRFKREKLEKDNYNSFYENNHYWLDSYSLFMALKDSYNGSCWIDWKEEHKNFKLIKSLTDDLIDKSNFYKFIQWIFYKQWFEFRKYTNSKGIKIIGDIPIFVSYDSADVWGNQELFKLDKRGYPKVVAGVPPDYFSETGQLWGNPIYNWRVMKENGFYWWIKRVMHTLNLVDCIRIDHFRGFVSCWEVKYGEKTAINGKWVKTAGHELFTALKNKIGSDLSEFFIAEDLGIITDDVVKLREEFSLPGMRILEFATFPSSDSLDKKNSPDPYLPENYIKNCVAYPGTHDNDTIRGWFNSLEDNAKKDVLHYFKIKDIKELNFAIIESLLSSKADRVLFLMQDILELDSSARMNKPGTFGSHNWSWRLRREELTEDLMKRLSFLNKQYGR